MGGREGLSLANSFSRETFTGFEGSSRKPDSTGLDLPGIALSDELSFVDEGDQSRLQHNVADLVVGLKAQTHRVPDYVRHSSPLWGCVRAEVDRNNPEAWTPIQLM